MTKELNYGAAAVVTAVLALSFFAAAPAYACGGGCGGGSDDTDNSVYVGVSNSGTIMNITTALSNTGGNVAGGSQGGDATDAGNGGSGGDANVSYGEANGGNGGYGGDANGGEAGPGGLVQTGDAEANAGSMNSLNTTDIEIEQADCGCDREVQGWYDEWGNFHQFRRGDVDNSVVVEVENEGAIIDMTTAGSNSGLNAAEGSEGGDATDAGKGGSGGEANAEAWYSECGCDVYGGHANAGHGADGGDVNGGAGGVGGTIVTGEARSNAGSINIMNTVLVRVLGR